MFGDEARDLIVLFNFYKRFHRGQLRGFSQQTCHILLTECRGMEEIKDFWGHGVDTHGGKRRDNKRYRKE
jgi:hypothetical protein